MTMRTHGIIFSGVLRGGKLIEIYYYRLIGLLGFEPYRGTMDVKLDKAIDIKMFATKSIEHIILDGSKMINAYMAPANIVFRKEDKEEKYSCWAMQEAHGIYSQDIVEIVAKDNLKEKFGIEDGNVIELEFTEKKPERKRKTISLMKKLKPRSTRQLMKSN